jgi:dihydrolipoamide dehydrogenase
MTNKIIVIPDIGGFTQVSIIDICVQIGSHIQAEESILVLESDKATIDIPSPYTGIIRKILVKIGDKINEGDAILELEIDADNKVEKALDNQQQTKQKISTPTSSPIDTITTTNIAAASPNKTDYDVVVIGAGPAGYSAAFRCADLGLKVAIIEKHANLGGVCLNVGCIPSKALLHMAEVLDEAKNMHHHGISFGDIHIDIDKIRAHKEQTIAKLTTGLAGMAKMRKVTILQGSASFIDAYHIQISNQNEQTNTNINTNIAFKHAIIANGSQAIKLPFLPQDERIVTSTGALALKSIPKRMLVIGGGIIGLEMATVYASLGSDIDIVEMSSQLMAGADTDLVKVWQKYNQSKFKQIMLQTKTISATAKEDGIHVEFESMQDNKTHHEIYDLVLVSVGRTPNGKFLNAQAAGIFVDERGFIPVDKQQRTNIAHIFAVGDVVGQPMLAHKGVHEGHIAAEVIAGHKAYFDAKQIPSVAYTNPEVAWAGLTEAQCIAQKVAFKKSVFPWQASGRAIANGRDEGFVKLLFDIQSGCIIGGAIVGTHAGDLIGEIALAIEMGADAVDIAKTIHPHPTLCESIGMAAEVFEGTCTDLPPNKKL